MKALKNIGASVGLMASLFVGAILAGLAALRYLSNSLALGTATGQGPSVQDIQRRWPGRAAATATTDFTIGRVKETGAVASVTITPDITITGADTNSLTVSIINKGQSGVGTTVIASKAFTSGVNGTGFDEVTITLSGTATNLDVVAGDILALSSIKVGTGLVDPGGLVRVVVNRD